MVRCKKKILLFWFLLVINLVIASDNVMKLVESNRKVKARNLLKHNTIIQAEKNNSTEEIFLAYDLQIVVEAIEKLNFSQCGQDAMIVMEAITKKERWAIEMFDSSSKFPLALLSGNFYQLGNFDECINLKQPFTNKKEPIKGQYCLADVQLLPKKQSEGRVARSFELIKDKPRHIFNNTMYWGICVPSSCSVSEIETVIKEIFNLATEQKNIQVKLNPDRCHVNKIKPFGTLEIIYGSVVGSFIIFVILVTFYHFYDLQNRDRNQDSSNHTFKEIIFCFSLIKNIRKFLETKSSSLNLECISGIKFISMAFILAGHTCLFLVGGPVQNVAFYEEQSRSFINAIFVNSPLLVDTFLLVSGFLMSYLLLLELEKRKGRINIVILYIARYIRLTPSYLIVIGFYCTYLLRLSNGPLWDSRIKLEQERCLKSWWTNILYINNYVNTDYLCMFQSWYLAADYHLFIIAPFFIYPLWKWDKIGKSFLGLGIFVSILTPFIITLKDNLDPSLMIFAPEVHDLNYNFYFTHAYIKTHMRAGSYFCGLLLGYILYKLQTKGTKMSKYVIAFGWLLSTLCGIISMTSIIIFYYPEHTYNAFEAAIYAALHRVAWCIFTGWVILVCVTKNARLVNSFLSWKAFIPLSRLTYCAYLMNGMVEIYYLGSIRTGTYLSKSEMGGKVLSHLVLTFSLAFLLCVFFESPIHGLEKILLRKDRRKDRNVEQRSNEVE